MGVFRGRVGGSMAAAEVSELYGTMQAQRAPKRTRLVALAAALMLTMAMVIVATVVSEGSAQHVGVTTQSLLTGQGMAEKMSKQMHHDGLKIPQNLLNQCGKACAKFAPHVPAPKAELVAKPAAVAGAAPVLQTPVRVSSLALHNSKVVKGELAAVQKEGGVEAVLKKSQGSLEDALKVMQKVGKIVGQ